VFEGEKTFVFWIGLIILGLASIGLFSMVWSNAINCMHALLKYVYDA